MTKYTLIAEHTDLYTGKTLTKNTTEFEVDGLMDVIENVEMFLKGTGFVFDGYLDIVPPEEDDIDKQEWHNPEWETPQENLEPTITILGEPYPAPKDFASINLTGEPLDTLNSHSKYYYDTERNK